MVSNSSGTFFGNTIAMMGHAYEQFQRNSGIFLVGLEASSTIQKVAASSALAAAFAVGTYSAYKVGESNSNLGRLGYGLLAIGGIVGAGIVFHASSTTLLQKGCEEIIYRYKGCIADWVMAPCNVRHITILNPVCYTSA